MVDNAAQDPWPVIAYQSRKVLLVVVGAGGTGSWVTQQLARLVWSFNRKWERAPLHQQRHASLLIVDHDLVELNNVEARQNFCPPEVGKPKAQVLANRYQLAFNLRTDEIAALVEPFSASIVPRYERDPLTILIGCVDNAEARQTIARCLEWNPQLTPRIWWIDAGNGEYFGQVLCGSTATLKDLKGCLHEAVCPRLPSPALVAPSLVTIPKKATQPTTQAYECGDVTTDEHGQSRTINVHMASLVYRYVEMLLCGGLTTFATYTDIESCTMHSASITPDTLAQALGVSSDFALFFTMDPDKKDRYLDKLAKAAVPTSPTSPAR